MTAFFRATILAVSLFALYPAASGSTALLRSNSRTVPSLFSVSTYEGSTDPEVAPVHPAPSLTLVLFTDGADPTRFDSLKRDLVSLCRVLADRPVRLAIVRNGALEVLGPVTGRVRLQTVLKPIEPAQPSAQISPAAILDSLSGGASQLGGRWSQVLLVGDFPRLEPDLREYASAILLRAFAAQQLRVSWFPLTAADDDWRVLFESTAGAIVHGSLADYLPALDDRGKSFFRVQWTPTPPSSGFVVFRSLLSGGQKTLLQVPDLAAAVTVPLPSIERYAAMQQQAADATALLSETSLSDEAKKRIRGILSAGFEVNPIDPIILRTATSFDERIDDFPAAIAHASSLVEVRPQEGTAYAALGHALLLGGQLDRADTALEHALRLNTHTAQVAEDFARIRLTRNDDQAALPYLEDALRLDARRQDLWFTQAHAAERLRNSDLAMRSFEHGLGLGGDHIPEAVSLLRLYSGAKQDSNAQELIARVMTDLPSDPGPRSQFAIALEQLHQPAAALAAWRRLLEIQPDSEPAHYGIARLLLESGDSRGAEQAAREGLETAPKSGRLYLAEAEAWEKLGRRYRARHVLQQGVVAAPEPDVLLRFAATEDTYGQGAEEAYAEAAESLPSSSPQRREALERGFAVSVRDGDFEHADRFAKSLQKDGHSDYLGLLQTEARERGGAIVPGGLEALAFAARAKGNIPPEKFFVEYCRTLVDEVEPKASGGKNPFVDSIEEHFERIAELESLGRRTGNSVSITLSLDGKDNKRNTEKVLRILGIKLRSVKGEAKIDSGQTLADAKKLETASALALDQVGVEEAIRAGKSYQWEIRDEPAPIYPDEKLWRDAFYPQHSAPGAFARTVLRVPKMGRLYVALSSLDRGTISVLLAALPLATINDKQAELLYRFAPAFGLQGDHATVPGGPRAETVWSQLAHASPGNPGALFRSLLETDDGRLLAFFFSLSELDLAHQAFFTANVSRAARFYKAFVNSEEIERRGPSTTIGHSSFFDVLRSVPLDEQGHLEFPGSPEVWLVAKGRSSSEAQTAKLLRKASRVAAPEIEDEILLRLAQKHYQEGGQRHTELDNFLAVVQIDAHRATPLDEESALLLAQRFSDSGGAYSYFTDLGALTASDFHQFFAAVDRMKFHPVLEANFQVGDLESLVEWICLLRRRHVIGDEDAAKLFRAVCDRFSSANDEADYTIASLESARAILERCTSREANPDAADERIRVCLLGAYSETIAPRTKDFQAVLELQKAPRLEVLFSVYDAVRKLFADTSATAQLHAMQKMVTDLPFLKPPKDTKISGKEKEAFAAYDPAAVGKVVDQLIEKAAKHRPNQKDIQTLCRQVLAAMEAQVTAALAGPLYAYFLRSSDLIVSQDPLLLRNHRYFDFASREAHHIPILEESWFNRSGEGTGSYFGGGFAQFGLAAGVAAAVGWKSGGVQAAEAVAAQIAALRAATWERLEESDQRLLSLRILVAREWVFESGRHPDAFRALSEESLGVLSLSRRADLLNGIEARNWRKALGAVTLPDLFVLGGKYLQHFTADPWSSPVTRELRAVTAENDSSRLNIFAAIPFHAFGCTHPHFLADAPYEEYEVHMFPIDLAERSAEFKMFLGFQADILGLEPSALANVAEPLAAKAFRTAQLTDARDWRSLFVAYASITAGDLKQALSP